MAAARQQTEWQRRWRQEDAVRVIRELSGTGKCESPFGEIDGREDLRGLTWPSPVSFRNVRVEDVDLSDAQVAKMLFVDSHLVNGAFARTQAVVLCNNSTVLDCFFKLSSLRTSGSMGNAAWERCNFEGADLKGGIFRGGKFVECSFDAAVIDGVEFGTSSLESCKLGTKLRKVFFRGALARCDFSQSSFFDCAFYGATFSDCVFSNDVIFFEHWQSSLRAIQESIKSGAFSPEATNVLETLAKVWIELGGAIVQQVIDRKDLVKLHGSSVGQEIFDFLKRYV